MSGGMERQSTVGLPLTSHHVATLCRRCCVCIPCTCCGPPVIFSKTPKCLCIDMTDCFGQQAWLVERKYTHAI